MAFMRIYQQIPIVCTEGAKTSIRAQQATPTDPYPELETLMAAKKLRPLGCDVVPDLLGYDQGTQEADDIVPGGHITYVIWDKVPGDSLTQERFWNRDRGSRDILRDEFRNANEQATLLCPSCVIKH